MDAARDKRLQRAYGITEAEWEARWQEQGCRCAICGRQQTPGKRPFHTDHDHSFLYLTVDKERVHDDPQGFLNWRASIKALPGVEATRAKRNDAIRAVRKQAKRKSVRGIICWKCNSGLKKFHDDPFALQHASDYLLKHKREAYGQ